MSLGERQVALDNINPMVTWGQILIGLSMFFGVDTRFSLFWAGVMMFLFYLAQFPPEYDLFFDYYRGYIIVYMALAAIGAGRVAGLGALIERMRLVRRFSWLKVFLG